MMYEYHEEKKKDWYMFQAYRGSENRVVAILKQILKEEKLDGEIDEIFIPTMLVVKISGGKKVSKEKVMFPGYILIKTTYNMDVFSKIKEIPKVIGFIGGQFPTVIEKEEVLQLKTAKIENVKERFQEGDSVRIQDGPFNGFLGIVQTVSNNERLKIMVEVFGRDVPVDVDIKDIVKAD